ncbi:MAG: hypothetical protein ACFFFT_05785 [Candidatus Thorarchaeota archaeon]
MSDSDWSKIDFQQFINEFGNEVLVDMAPVILYSKKDKEHEAYNSLIAFFFIAGGVLIYIASTYFLAPIFFNLPLFISIIAIATIIDILLIINYIKTNVYIKPLECWLEIFRGKSENNYVFYCFTYYPIFSGKCHPNAAKNVIFKLYQEQVLKSKIDIPQIEVYIKITSQDKKLHEKIGYFLQYGEGNSFRDESIDRNSWKFFSYQKSENDNFLAVANWEHQFEWRDDLEYDFDKLHEYAPWVIQRWNNFNLKPLKDDFKTNINWDLRNIDSLPKLKPWKGDLELQEYQNPNANKEESLINEAIKKFVGYDQDIKRIKDIKDQILAIKSYFRDLNS